MASRVWAVLITSILIIQIAGFGIMIKPVDGTHIGCGSVITTSVTLDSDIGPCSGDGLIVSNANNIIIDLNGHRITGMVSGPTFGPSGIHLINSNNVEIKDGIISDFSFGIFLEGSFNNLIHDNEVFGGSNGIILLFSSNQNTISDNYIHDNLLGCGGGVTIEFVGSSNLVHDNRIERNCFGVALAFTGVDSNVVSDNEITDNFVGIEAVISANSNTIKDNEVSNSSVFGITVQLSANSNQIIDNDISNSGSSDLFWDLTGTGNCWKDNEFVTSNPAILPSCEEEDNGDE